MTQQKLCIIGVGLIGGSLARAARNEGAFQEIIGCSRNVEHLQYAVKLGVIDRFETDISKAVEDCDMIVLAVPLGAMRPVFEQLANAIPSKAIITDVGSAKKCVIEDARNALGNDFSNFVPGHPIAGTEKSGVEASFAELFQNRRVILTPTTETNADAVGKVRALWESAGAKVTDMDASHHDEILAATSHLPHILAYTLVDTLAGMNEHNEIFQYAAGGFRDFTRIASSDPVMWRDICMANRDAILKALDRYQHGLTALSQVIRDQDGDSLLELFEKAKLARDANIKTD
jgi:prephenate dehydrogenase